MTPYTTSTAELLFVEVPPKPDKIWVDDDRLHTLHVTKHYDGIDEDYASFLLPPGPWQLLGLGSDITEEQAREIPKEYLTSAYVVLQKK